jgi:O-antigen/teichoic acid export membrane protein
MVKLLLANFAGLASIAWYEMAGRLITQVRAVVVNAMEALVPHVAALGDAHHRNTLAADYRRVFALNLALTSSGMGLVVANLPIIGWLWIGHTETHFLLFALLLAATWWVNALAVPAYFVAQGLGVQRWNVVSHVTMALANSILGFFLGKRFGGIGVLVAFGIAIAAGTIVILVGMHRHIATITQRAVSVTIPVGYVLPAVIVLAPLAYATQSTSPTAIISLSVLASIAALATLAYTGDNRGYLSVILARFRPSPSRPS